MIKRGDYERGEKNGKREKKQEVKGRKSEREYSKAITTSFQFKFYVSFALKNITPYD